MLKKDIFFSAHIWTVLLYRGYSLANKKIELWFCGLMYKIMKTNVPPKYFLWCWFFVTAPLWIQTVAYEVHLFCNCCCKWARERTIFILLIFSQLIWEKNFDKCPSSKGLKYFARWLCVALLIRRGRRTHLLEICSMLRTPVTLHRNVNRTYQTWPLGPIHFRELKFILSKIYIK